MILSLAYPSWLHPEIFPGLLPIRWYSLSYIIAFFMSYTLFKKLHKEDPFLTNQHIENMFFSAIVGLLIGGRLFYVIFYNLEYFIHQPWQIIWPFSNGSFVGIQGLAYHGGALGTVIGLATYTYRHKISFLRTADIWATVIPFGYTFGRLGNFANAELYGKATTRAWGMIFPDARPFSAQFPWVREMAQELDMEIVGTLINLPRHPSQLYQALFEGVLLGLFLLFVLRPRVKVPGQLLAAYFAGYGLVRFFIEYLREPDAHLGYIIALGAGADSPGLFVSWFNFSMGQIFSALMILGGLAFYYWFGRSSKKLA